MNAQTVKIPFVLLFLEEHIGAEGMTTCGSFGDIDAADNT